MSGTAVATQGQGGALAAVANAHETEGSNSRGPKQFLKFSKGEWSLGKEGIEFAEQKFHFVPAMDLWEKGWQCWVKKMPVDEHFVPYGQPVPKKAELPDHGPYTEENDGWQEAIRVPLIVLPGLGGHDTVFMGCEFSAMSTGARNALYSLSKDYANWIKRGEVTEEKPYVIVEAGADSYKHKQYGKVHFPVFSIVQAVSKDELQAMIDGAGTKVDAKPDPVDDDKPKPTTKAAGSTAKPSGSKKPPFKL
jgi:hypothetical protein